MVVLRAVQSGKRSARLGDRIMINLFKSGKKTFVETLFLIAPESDAQKIWSTNRDQLAKDFKSLQEKNIDDEMISWFHCFTVDELYDPAYIAKTRQYLDHDKGRALFVLPEDFAHRLSTMDPSEADTLAEQCLHAEQFVTWKAKRACRFLTRLASLAQEAKKPEGKKYSFCSMHQRLTSLMWKISKCGTSVCRAMICSLPTKSRKHLKLSFRLAP